MIMMPDCWRWSSLQLKAQADFWHPACPMPRYAAPGSSHLNCHLGVRTITVCIRPSVCGQSQE